VLDSTGVDLRTVRIPDRAVLAFGSERHGISDDLRRSAHELVAIPIRDQVSSYNLASAVAIALYQWSVGSEPAGADGP
jgi:TrmH family RNA methyltransferase